MSVADANKNLTTQPLEMTMTSSTTDIQNIKQQLLDARELERIGEAFFDWFEANPFEPEDAHLDDPGFLARLVASTAKQALGEKTEVQLGGWFRHADERFVHGSFAAGGRAGMALFFEDIAMGFIMLVDFTGGPTHYARIACVSAPPPDPSRN